MVYFRTGYDPVHYSSEKVGKCVLSFSHPLIEYMVLVMCVGNKTYIFAN